MSVYRPKGSDARRCYRYDFIVNGRRFSGSTGETTRAAAERVERRIRAEVTADKPPRDPGTIDAAFAAWWHERGQHDAKARVTFQRLARLQDLLEAVLREDGEPPTLAAIRTRHLATYVARRRAQLDHRHRFPSPATVNRELQVLRRVMRHALKVWERPIEVPHFADVLLVEADPVSREVPAEVVVALRAALRPDYRDLFDWLLLVGARVGNAAVTEVAAHLRPEDVDFAGGVAAWRVKSRRPGGRLVTVPLTAPMAAILERNIGRHPDAVFTYVARRTRDGRVRGDAYPITYSAFYHAFKRAAAAVGRPHLRVHDLRHTAGTHVLRTTRNMALTQRLLGHQDIATTSRYAHVLLEDLRAGLDAAHAARLETPTEFPTAAAKARGKTLKRKD